jgi:hypothetical protein
MAAAALLGAFGSLEGRASQASTAPTRVVDRTFLCTTVASAGVRTVTVEARAGLRSGVAWRWPASISVHNAGAPELRAPGGPTSSTLRWVVSATAGAGAGPASRPGLAARTRERRSACSPSSARALLTARGLVSRSTFYPGDEYECLVPGRVLVRIRGVFRSPVTFRPALDPGPFRTLRAAGELQSASVAVRTVAGRPLIAASVSASGMMTRVLTARGCT